MADSKFQLGDYVDVAERIRLAVERFPELSLQFTWEFQEIGDRLWIVGKAYAYRNPGDPTPGIGHAWEPVPGTTPYTRGSELMNCETSAWGRALAALGVATKKIASREEIELAQQRQTTPEPAASRRTVLKASDPITDGQRRLIFAALKSLNVTAPQAQLQYLIDAIGVTIEHSNELTQAQFDQIKAQLLADGWEPK